MPRMHYIYGNAGIESHSEGVNSHSDNLGGTVCLSDTLGGIEVSLRRWSRRMTSSKHSSIKDRQSTATCGGQQGKRHLWQSNVSCDSDMPRHSSIKGRQSTGTCREGWTECQLWWPKCHLWHSPLHIMSSQKLELERFTSPENKWLDERPENCMSTKLG